MTIISEVVLMILVIYLLFTGVYQIFLVLCYFLIKEPPDSNNNEQITNKFAVLVPSHDEELLIASFCESILSIEYLKDQYDVFIIADNCSDQTEDICLQYPVTVLSRQDTTKLGKGYALDWAVEWRHPRDRQGVVAGILVVRIRRFEQLAQMSRSIH